MTTMEISRKLLSSKMLFILLGFMALFLLIYLYISDHFFAYKEGTYTKGSIFQRLNNGDIPKRNDWRETNDAPAPCNVSVPYLLSDEYFRASCDPTLSVDITEVMKGSKILLGNIAAINTTCPRTLGLTPFRLPSTGLMSWPGSGNTWTRHLIQQLTGIMTGAVYYSKRLKENGFPGEGRHTDVIVVKCHYPAVLGNECHYERQVLVMRNPFDSFAAEYKRSRMKLGHIGKANILPDSAWQGFARASMKDFPKFVKMHLAFQGPQLILMYEDMKSCLLRVLLRLSNFLQWGKLRHFSLCCVIRNSEGSAYRNQGRVPVYYLYEGKLLEDMNEMLSTLAKNVSVEYPMFAKRLLNYRLF